MEKQKGKLQRLAPRHPAHLLLPESRVSGAKVFSDPVAILAERNSLFGHVSAASTAGLRSRLSTPFLKFGRTFVSALFEEGRV